MNLFLLHNANAGGKRDRPDTDQLIQMLRDSGHTVTYQSTRGQSAHWKVPVDTDLVIAAGGDGTVRKAALAVTGRHIPFAIIPLGTANNIAKSLNLVAPAADIIANLDSGKEQPFDLGIATGPWGQTPFVESAGAGAVARNISYLGLHSGGSSTQPVVSSLAHLSDRCQNYEPHTCSAWIDGRELSGRFVLVEAMNTPSLGPNLVLAPASDPGDRFLDFVFLPEEARRDFIDYLSHPEDWQRTPPPVEIIRGQQLSLQIQGIAAIHADDYTWPDEAEQATPPPIGHRPPAFSLKVDLSAEPVQVWITS